MSIKIGNTTLRTYNHEKAITPKFKNGGWQGIVVFEDIANSELVVCRTTKLSSYLKSIDFTKVKNGVFGKKVSMMSYQFMKVHFYEMSNISQLREVESLFRREITKKKKKLTNQMELDLKPKKRTRTVRVHLKNQTYPKDNGIRYLSKKDLPLDGLDGVPFKKLSRIQHHPV